MKKTIVTGLVLLAMLASEVCFSQRVVESRRYFVLENPSSQLCLAWHRNLADLHGSVHLVSCSKPPVPQPTTWHWSYDIETLELKGGGLCLDSEQEDEAVLKDCHGNKGDQQWLLREDGQIRQASTGLCVNAENAGPARLGFCDSQAFYLSAPPAAYTQPRSLLLLGSNLGVAVQNQAIENYAPIVLQNTPPDRWLMQESGRIVREGHPSMGLTVYYQQLQSGSKIILHEGDNEWMVLPDGSIVLKSRPSLGLALENQSADEGSSLVLGRNFNQWSWGEIETAWQVRDSQNRCVQSPEGGNGPVEMYLCDQDQSRQLFDYTEDGIIRADKNDLCLEAVEYQGNVIAIMRPCSEEPSQKWVFRKKQGDLQNRENKLCLQSLGEGKKARLVDCLAYRQEFRRSPAYVVSPRPAQLDVQRFATPREYTVAIDTCHSKLTYEGTSNTVTVEFWYPTIRREFRKSVSLRGISDGCSGDDEFKVTSDVKFSHFTISTDGDNALFIDELYISVGDRQTRHLGQDDGAGWCLSTDVNDGKSWKKGDGLSGTDGRCVPQWDFGIYR